MGRNNPDSGDRNSRSKTGGLVLVLLFIWLAGLTGLFFYTMQSKGSGDLEARVSALERRSTKVVRKINPAGGKQLANLERRVNQLEKQLSDTNMAGNISGEATQASASQGSCNCNELVARLDKLEGALLAKTGQNRSLSSDLTAAATPDNKASGKNVKTPVKDEKTKPKSQKVVQKRRKRKARKISKHKKATSHKTYRASRETLPYKTYRGASRQNYTKYDPMYGGDSVFDMTRRMGSMVDSTESQTKSINRLAPGAAVYPNSMYK